MGYRWTGLVCWVVAVWVSGLACQNAEVSERPPSEEGECRLAMERPASLVVAGSGSNLALMEALVERYREENPWEEVWIPESIGTRGAVRAVKDGAVDVGLASRPLREEELGDGVLVAIPLAQSPVVLAAHPSVKAVDVSRSDLIKLYQGEDPRWSEKLRAIPLLRESGDSGNLAISRIDPELFKAMERARSLRLGAVLHTDQEMRDTLLKLPGACGFIDEGILKLERLPLVVLPIRDGRGEVSKQLLMLARRDRSDNVQNFVEFVNAPAQDDIFERGGYRRAARP